MLPHADVLHVPEFFHDTRRNLLVYRSQSPFVLQAIPEARQVNGQFIAVPRTLRNSQVLRHFDLPVAPVMTDMTYDWPIEPGWKPLAHQKVMANFQVLHPRCFNLSDPGTMKTLAALWAADFLMRGFGEDFRALIVAPLTILEDVWAAALWKNFLGRRSFEILTGSAEKRRALLAKRADFSIINFDGVGVGAHTRKRFDLDGFSKELAERDDIKLVIVDEASGYSDASTKRHRLARAIIGKRPYLWQLTGSPTPQAPTDAYGLAKLTNNAHGKSFKTFQQETMFKPNQFSFRWFPRRGGYELARRLLTPAIRFDIAQVWNGPPMTIQSRTVELTAEQKKLMAELKRDLQVMLRSGKKIEVINEGVARGKFLQISLGAIYDTEHDYHTVDAEPRMREIEAIIDSTIRKIVCFVPLTSVLNIVKKRLSKRWKCEVINGDVPSKERPDVIQRFATDDSVRIILCDPQTTAHGINEFVVADTVIWVGPTEKAELWIQGNKRVHRPGQKHPTTIYQIVSNPLEREIYRRLETNTSMQGVLLEMVRRGEI
jgi:hypothetical protein